MLAQAYNDWVLDYCGADRRRLFPCAVLPLQSVEASIAELRRVAALGFKAAAVRPCFWNGRYPTLPEFDPLWREFEATGLVLAMHTFPSREALTPEWAPADVAGARTVGAGAAVHRRGGRLLARPVRLEHHRGHGPRHRRLRDARLPDGGDDVGHRGRADRLAREVPAAQGGRARVERLVAAADPGAQLQLLEPVRVPARQSADPRSRSRSSTSAASSASSPTRRSSIGLWDVFQDVGDLVVRLSAPRRRGRVGRPASHGRVQRARSRRSASCWATTRADSTASSR